MPSVDLRRLAKRREDLNDGLEAVGGEQAIADQIQSTRVRVNADGMPRADLGILRFFGARLGRSLEVAARAWCPDTPTYDTKELLGPTAFNEWRRSRCGSGMSSAGSGGSGGDC